MQIHRLFETVYILMERKSITAQELATHFEVSKRTILRDVEALSIAGIPVYTSRGKGGGISLLDNFVLNTRWLGVDFSRWGKGKEDQEKFEMLKQAIIKRRVIAFVYVGTSGDITRREVYPLRLVFKSKAWYIQAFCSCKQDYRTFKANRIQRLEILEKTFVGNEFTLPLIESEDTSAKLIHLKLQFPMEMAYRIYDEFDMSEVKKNGDDSFTVTVDLPEDGWLYSFLLSFGGAVKIISPQKVKAELIKRVEKMKKVYS